MGQDRSCMLKCGWSVRSRPLWDSLRPHHRLCAWRKGPEGLEILTKAVEVSARVHGYGTFQSFCDHALVPPVNVRAFGLRHNAARAGAGGECSTGTCSTGMGATGVSHTRTGAAAGRFSSAEQEFRNADRGVSGPV